MPSSPLDNSVRTAASRERRFPRFRTRTPPPGRPRQPTRRVLVQSRMRRRRATSPSVPSSCTTRNQPATMAPTYVPDTSRCRRPASRTPTLPTLLEGHPSNRLPAQLQHVNLRPIGRPYLIRRVERLLLTPAITTSVLCASCSYAPAGEMDGFTVTMSCIPVRVLTATVPRLAFRY